MSNRQDIEKIHDSIDRAALAGAQEIEQFLKTYKGDDPVALTRVRYGAVGVKNYLEKFSSQNGLLGLIMGAAERTGVPPEQTLKIAKEHGLLPDAAESKPLKLAARSRRK